MANSDALHNMIASRLDAFDEKLSTILLSMGEFNEHLKKLNGSVAKHEDRIYSEELIREIIVRDIKELKAAQEQMREQDKVYAQRSFEIWSKLGWITLGIIGSIIYTTLKKVGIINF